MNQSIHEKETYTSEEMAIVIANLLHSGEAAICKMCGDMYLTDTPHICADT